MQKAYIILAHKYPAQLCRLHQALNDGSSTFFIHIDKKSEIAEFRELITDEKIYWVDRIKSNWGEFGLVEAILNLLKAVKDSGESFDRIILLSGQDYPIKSNELINEYLSTAPEKTFLSYHNLPDHTKWQPNGGMYRVTKYFFGLGLAQRWTAKAMNFLAMVFPYLQRKMPQGMKPYAGSTWWIIDDYGLHYILDFVERNPKYVSFHKKTFAADELFFHMILLNASDEKLQQGIVNDDKRFIRWGDITASHPDELNEADLFDMEHSDALFARKFNITHDDTVLNLIDRNRRTVLQAL